MDAAVSVEKAIKDLHQVYKTCYIESCRIDGDELSDTDCQALTELSVSEVCEQAGSLLVTLLDSKRRLCNFDRDETARTNLALEKQIQKLEQDVRQHVSIEQQLSLHLEDTREALEHASTIEDFGVSEVGAAAKIAELKHKFDNEVERLQTELDSRIASRAKAVTNTQQLTEQLEAAKSQLRNKRSLELRLKKLEEIAEAKQRQIYKLEVENMKLKSGFEEQQSLNAKIREKHRQLLTDSLLRNSSTGSLNRSVKQLPSSRSVQKQRPISRVTGRLGSDSRLTTRGLLASIEQPTAARQRTNYAPVLNRKSIAMVPIRSARSKSPDPGFASHL